MNLCPVSMAHTRAKRLPFRRVDTVWVGCYTCITLQLAGVWLECCIGLWHSGAHSGSQSNIHKDCGSLEGWHFEHPCYNSI